jgi:type VI secretion system protein ImpK
MTTATAQSVTDLLPVALRDTSRTVVALRSANPPSLHELRTQCDAQTAGLRSDLHRQGHPGDVIDDALYAQCALLDEAALSGLGGSAREAWEREPLQVRVFGRNDAGEELLRRIAARLREVKPVLPLLGIFAAVLAMGFKGRYAVGDPAARAALVRSLDERLERATAGSAGVQDQSGPVVVNPLRRRRRVFSPLAWVLIACIAGGLAWFAIDRWLLSSIADMPH